MNALIGDLQEFMIIRQMMEKEREEVINALIERENLLKRIIVCKERNYKSSVGPMNLSYEVFGDLNNLRSEFQERECLM